MEGAGKTALPAAGTPAPEEAPELRLQPNPAAQQEARHAAFVTFLNEKVCFSCKAPSSGVIRGRCRAGCFTLEV